METLTNLLDGTDKIFTIILVIMLVPIGLYLTIRTGVVQLRMLPEMFRVIVEPAGHDAEGNRNISPFRAFCISAASRVGTANIAGVALAISTGGPGAMFWMWVTAIVGGATAFTESTLGQLYKVKDGPQFRGGPAYYIANGLSLKWLGAVFAVIVAVTYGIVFNTVQSNSIVDGMSTSFGDMAESKTFAIVLGIVLAVAAGAIFVGGVQRISSAAAIIVPVMAVLYLGIGILVVAGNLDKVPGMLGLIFSQAFTLHSVAGGTLGSMMLIGIQRGLFSNEAGIGSVPNAAATSSASHPAKQGLVQALGVYFDTILVCSITGFIVLLSNPEYGGDAEGAQLTQNALSAELGQWAIHFLTVAIFFFAFSSILGNYYYGETNIEYLTRSRGALWAYRIIVMGAVFLGAVAALDLVWTAANIFMAIMAVINLFAVAALSNKALRVLKNYTQQRKAGLEPVFHEDDIDGGRGITAWDGTDEVTQPEFWAKRGRKVRDDSQGHAWAAPRGKRHWPPAPVTRVPVVPAPVTPVPAAEPSVAGARSAWSPRWRARRARSRTRPAP
ncbi:alanine/glycine:cation symporter family protein [Brevibacterium sp. BRM-1]|uniref:alanine/glycine:cation symporter family protein n=1 Tax=Brevibacterium sp. BRM-1 TaxID=2999062 RepID=UPI00227F6D8A|nr:alanine/glycine:cation symporter family protein [Brevibacterium sp. BRM-1]WAL39367.1 alanine/glycine:cation symporter family protein [Brevibacterium sp. BRM-1]